LGQALSGIFLREGLALELASDPYGEEFAAAHAEDIASAAIDLHLPEERLRIQDLLSVFPQDVKPRPKSCSTVLGRFAAKTLTRRLSSSPRTSAP
jgi:hypothetical protein